LDHPTTHTIILGAKSPEEYESAVAATVLPPLSPAELEAISALRDKLSS
jgi:aryl-alcohol dehydrogenase-like predicted oxidoreductase